MIGMRLASGKSACQIFASRITLLEMLQQISASPISTNPTKLIVSPQNTKIRTSPSTKASAPIVSTRLIHLRFSAIV